MREDTVVWAKSGTQPDTEMSAATFRATELAADYGERCARTDLTTDRAR